jgi:thiamine biosynthesis lipoprotein
MHHLVDPTTGRPADPVWRTVTVAADTCVEANTVSTAAVVRGKAAPRWIETLGNPTRLEAADGSVLLLNGWPA